MNLPDHNLAKSEFNAVRYEVREAIDMNGRVAKGLHDVWITLDNPRELNSYTTEMVKQVVLAFRKASNDRAAVCVVFTGAGTRAFCSGGNVREYAEVYAGRPQEYRQYMRLFNDMVTAILTCDKPVICRVNGLRVGGGQEIGMACDFSVASDLARFGQAGPRHGSVPDGGATDFLDLFVGIERAIESCTLCELWSAHKVSRLGLLTEIAPALKLDGKFVPNPMVITDRWLDEAGRIVYGEPHTGDEMEKAKAKMARGEIDLARLDASVARLTGSLLQTFPECTTKTLESLRKKKLEHWDRNRESNRAWLALNMLTEGRAGFRAFHSGGKTREVDFVALRQRLAQGESWGPELFEAIAPETRGD